MVRAGTIWGNIRQRQTKVILSVAAVNGLELDQAEWGFGNRPAEFTTKFTYGKIPTFEGVDGFKLIEGSTIARYLSSIGTEVNLLGSTPQEVAIVDQWMHFAEHEVGVPAGNMMGTIYQYYNTFNAEILDKNQERLVRALKYIESHLAARPSGYVALDKLTLADFVLASGVYSAAIVALGTAERAEYPHIFAHYDRVAADERVKEYWSKEDFVDARVMEARQVPSA